MGNASFFSKIQAFMPAVCRHLPSTPVLQAPTRRKNRLIFFQSLVQIHPHAFLDSKRADASDRMSDPLPPPHPAQASSHFTTLLYHNPSYSSYYKVVVFIDPPKVYIPQSLCIFVNQLDTA